MCKSKNTLPENIPYLLYSGNFPVLNSHWWRPLIFVKITVNVRNTMGDFVHTAFKAYCGVLLGPV